MTTQVQIAGKTFDFDAVVNLMDDDLREEIHTMVGRMNGFMFNEQSYVDFYRAEHEKKFGAEFVVN